MPPLSDQPRWRKLELGNVLLHSCLLRPALFWQRARFCGRRQDERHNFHERRSRQRSLTTAAGSAAANCVLLKATVRRARKRVAEFHSKIKRGIYETPSVDS